jgi:hypothetical protein
VIPRAAGAAAELPHGNADDALGRHVAEVSGVEGSRGVVTEHHHATGWDDRFGTGPQHGHPISRYRLAGHGRHSLHEPGARPLRSHDRIFREDDDLPTPDGVAAPPADEQSVARGVRRTHALARHRDDHEPRPQPQHRCEQQESDEPGHRQQARHPARR